MNTIVTSKEAILEVSRKLVIEQGIKAVNIRTVASLCGVSVGSIYNYFPSKADLLTACVEDVWKHIFHMAGSEFKTVGFKECIEWLYESILSGCKEYPGFFTFHSFSFEQGGKKQGRAMMERYFGHMHQSLLKVLKHDPKLKKEAFNETLSEENFVKMIFSMTVTLLLEGKEDCRGLLTIIERTIY